MMKIYKHDSKDILIINSENQKQFEDVVLIETKGCIRIESVLYGLTTIRSGGYTSINSGAPRLTTIRSGGYTSINSGAQVPRLTTIRSGGDTSINSGAPRLTTIRSGKELYVFTELNPGTEIRLWKNHRNNKWHLSDQSSEFLLSQKGEIKYQIANVSFDDGKELFDKIRKDELMAQEVFAIENTEQRRIAYERMDKSKMKELKGFTVLDEHIDNYGNPEKIIQFSIEDFDIPFIYFNCFCPSTKREYFIETDQLTCLLAKARSFGFDKEIRFSEEW